MKGNEVQCKANRRGNFYFLRQSVYSANAAEVKMKYMAVWHQRLGYLNELDLKILANNKMANDIRIRPQQEHCKRNRILLMRSRDLGNQLTMGRIHQQRI